MTHKKWAVRTLKPRKGWGKKSTFDWPNSDQQRGKLWHLFNWLVVPEGWCRWDRAVWWQWCLQYLLDLAADKKMSLLWVTTWVSWIFTWIYLDASRPSSSGLLCLKVDVVEIRVFDGSDAGIAWPRCRQVNAIVASYPLGIRDIPGGLDA